MPRYPFMTQVNKYMDKQKGVWGQGHWNITYRRFRRINNDLLMLQKEGKVSTNSPSKLTVEDLRVYLVYRLSLGYTSGEYLHDQYALQGFFKSRFVKNTAFDECLEEYPSLRARKYHRRLSPISDQCYDKLVAFSNEAVGWKNVRACALVMLAVTSGARLNEIRQADLIHLNVDSWIFDIVNVKGHATYGEPRSVLIHPVARPVLLKYLALLDMSKRFGNLPADSTALFPSKDSSDGFLSGNSLRRIKDDVADIIGESFNFQKLRRTFAQRLVDADVPIESVSVVLGHATTKTTELNYARRRLSTAINDMERSFK